MTRSDEVCLHDPAAAAAQELPVLLRRVRADYREMPGLVLNRHQMQRLWAIDALLCDALIQSLLETRVVRRAGQDRYVPFGSAA